MNPYRFFFARLFAFGGFLAVAILTAWIMSKKGYSAGESVMAAACTSMIWLGLVVPTTFSIVF